MPTSGPRMGNGAQCPQLNFGVDGGVPFALMAQYLGDLGHGWTVHMRPRGRHQEDGPPCFSCKAGRGLGGTDEFRNGCRFLAYLIVLFDHTACWFRRLPQNL